MAAKPHDVVDLISTTVCSGKRVKLALVGKSSENMVILPDADDHFDSFDQVSCPEVRVECP